MHLSDEEKLSILDESRDSRFQEEVKLLSTGSKRMGLAEYLDFLNAVSKMIPVSSRRDDFTNYHTVIF